MKKIFLYSVLMFALAACGGSENVDDGSVIVSNDYINVSSSSVQLSGDDSEKDLAITANCSWSISSDVDWVSVNPKSGNGDAMVTVSASLNSTGSDRTATIIVRTERSSLEKKVRVTQGTPIGAIVPSIDDNLFPD